MATSFPTGLDALTNPTSADGLNSPDHAGQHADANDAIEALEAKVGVDGSAVTTSIDYKIANGILPKLAVNSSDLVVDNVNRYVGIGNSVPQAKLDVSLGAGSVPAVRITNNGTGYSLLVEDSVSTDTTPFAIDASGNVSIQKQTASYALDNSGTTRSADYIVGTGTKYMPRGVIAYGTNTTADAAVGITEKTVINTSSFTAIASRIYRITAYEPQIASPATAGAYAVGRLRLNSLTGTQLVNSIIQNAPATGVNFTMVTSWVGTLTAASTTIYYTIQASVASFNAQRSATAPAYLIVEDLGTTS